jgi:cell pole-organizing protein PopZ
MSAASPKTQDKAAEPSMEEILASIRRIIADDQAVKPEATPVRSTPPLPENDDVLDLAEVAEPVRKVEAAPKPIEPEPIDFGDLTRCSARTAAPSRTSSRTCSGRC